MFLLLLLLIIRMNVKNTATAYIEIINIIVNKYIM